MGVAVLAAVFVTDGILQCLGRSFLVPVTSLQDLPSWLPVIIGSLEIAAGTFLLLSRSSLYAALYLCILMIAGAYLHLRFTGGISFVAPSLLCAAVGIIGYERSPRVLSMRRFRSAIDAFAESEILREELRREAVVEPVRQTRPKARRAVASGRR
jgi:hypothetical protein